MSYSRMLPAALIAGVLFFHFPHILGVVQPGSPPANPATPPMPAGPIPPTNLNDVYVSENLNGGARLQLSNGDMYDIHPSDRDISGGWLLPSNVKITPTKDPNYPLMITDTVTNTSVRARKFDPSAPPPNPNQKMPPKKPAMPQPAMPNPPPSK